MATPHIQFRIYSASIGLPPADQPVIGEPFWDPDIQCFGVYSDNNKINWYPSVVDDLPVFARNIFKLQKDQVLGGLVAGGQSTNRLIIDYSTANEIQIKDRITNEVYHRFGVDGAMFNSATVQGSTRLGLINQMINSGLNVTRSFGVPSVPRVTGASDGKRSLVFAPNWQLWCAPDRTGILEARLSDDVPFPSCPKSVECKVLLTPVHAGLRTFLHSTSALAGRQVNFSVYIKGPAGKATYVRALTSGGVLDSIVVIGSGNWERQAFAVTMPSRALLADANFIAFDTLYNPVGNEAAGTWYVAAPQLAFGAVPVEADIRPAAVEKSLLQSLYAESKIRTKRGESHELHWELQPGFTEVELESSSGLPNVITEKDHLGGILTVNNTGNNNDFIRIKVAAFRLPYLEESLGS